MENVEEEGQISEVKAMMSFNQDLCCWADGFLSNSKESMQTTTNGLIKDSRNGGHGGRCHELLLERSFCVKFRTAGGHTVLRSDNFVDSASYRLDTAADVGVYRGKQAPLCVKCQRVVSHVYSVASFGSEHWSWP